MSASNQAATRAPLVIAILSIVAGLSFALGGCAALLVLAIGRFDEGRGGTVAVAIVCLSTAASLLVLPTHRRLGKILGGIALLIFAAIMLGAAFAPGLAGASPGIFQAAAIALGVLLVARLGLGMFRKPRTKEM